MFSRRLEQHEPQREIEEQGLIAKRFPIVEIENMICEGIIVDAATVATFGLLRLKKMI